MREYRLWLVIGEEKWVVSCHGMFQDKKAQSFSPRFSLNVIAAEMADIGCPRSECRICGLFCGLFPSIGATEIYPLLASVMRYAAKKSMHVSSFLKASDDNFLIAPQQGSKSSFLLQHLQFRHSISQRYLPVDKHFHGLCISNTGPHYHYSYDHLIWLFTKIMCPVILFCVPSM